MECRGALEASVAHLDVNNDGANDFSCRRDDLIAYVDERGAIIYAPPPVNNYEYQDLLQEIASDKHPLARLGKLPQLVLTSTQYSRLSTAYENCFTWAGDKARVWLNSE